MSKSAKIYEYFPGGNTPQGFFSYYHNILPQERAKRIITIKGGPGTGKSTLMKSVAAKLIAQGFDCELAHCSSDNSSLDGIVFPALGFCMLDGTAPHIVDPKTPAAVDEILNMGMYWDAHSIIPNKDKIIECNKKISTSFASAYHFLSAAKQVEDDIDAMYKAVVDPICISIEFNALAHSLKLERKGDKYGWNRELFLSAITPLGVTDYIGTYVENANKVYRIASKKNPYSHLLLDKIRTHALELGLDCYSFFGPMSPAERLEHLYLPSEGIFFTIQPGSIENQSSDIDLDKYIPMFPPDKSAEISTATSIFELLLSTAIYRINRAKKQHDVLETYYAPHMHFDKISELADEIALQAIRTLL